MAYVVFSKKEDKMFREMGGEIIYEVLTRTVDTSFYSEAFNRTYYSDKKYTRDGFLIQGVVICLDMDDKDQFRMWRYKNPTDRVYIPRKSSIEDILEYIELLK